MAQTLINSFSSKGILTSVLFGVVCLLKSTIIPHFQRMVISTSQQPHEKRWRETGPGSLQDKEELKDEDVKEIEVGENEDIRATENGTTEAYKVTFTAAEERKLLWKVDLHVLPWIMVLYGLSFIDRVNIGNANIQGMSKELGLHGTQYNQALFIFFIGYILLEVPSNIILKKIKPTNWLSLIMIAWGAVTIATGCTQNFGGLVTCRVLLGIFEAGLFPGATYVISQYYKRYELQRRYTIFFCASILASAFGGLLAYALVEIGGTAGYSGWRWIFIIEGLVTVVAGALGKFLLADFPETAKFLTDRERAILSARLKEDAGVARMDRLDKEAVKRIMTDWKIYVGTISYMGVVTTGYAGSLFTPTILADLGWHAQRAQVLSIPVSCVAAVLTCIAAWLADRTKHRMGYALFGVGVASIGYLILLCGQSLSNGVLYMAVFFVVSGGYIAQPIVITWLANNVAGHYKRGFSSALQIGIGNIGGIIASNVFLTREAPGYKTGYATCFALILVCGLSCVVFATGLMWENRQRNKGRRDYRYAYPPETRENLGDDWPGFRFVI